MTQLARLAVGLVVLMAASVSHGAAALAQDDSLEWAAKAAYLPRFVGFVQWPEGSFRSPNEVVRICVVGFDPFGDILDRAAEGLVIDDRPFAVLRFTRVDRDHGCHVMYITGSQAQSISEALAAVQGTAVLTVTNSSIAAAPKGVIHFVIRENRVRFQIDAERARANQLGISAELLEIALAPGGALP